MKHVISIYQYNYYIQLELGAKGQRSRGRGGRGHGGRGQQRKAAADVGNSGRGEIHMLGIVNIVGIVNWLLENKDKHSYGLHR